MATFKFGRAIDLHWNGYDIQGPAETVFSIPDQLYEEFDADIAPVEPTLVWIDTNEFLTLSNSVSVSQLNGTFPISVTTTTSGKNVAISSSTNPAGYTMVADGTGGVIFQAASTGALTSIVGVSPMSTIIVGNTASVILDANYQTAGTYVTGVVGTSPISASGTTAITVTIDQAAITGATAATNAQIVRFLVKNTTGTTIPKGSAVYVSGATGDNALISLASATSETTSSKTLGITAESIANDAFGYVIEAGYLTNIDTSATTAGAAVWLGNTPGSLSFVSPPAEPSHSVYLGVVVRVQAINGSILVKVQNGYELDELHDVFVGGVSTALPLVYSTTSSGWVAQALTSVGIATGAVGSAQIAAGAVGSAQIAAGAVGSAALADNAVVAAKISAGSVGTAAISSGAATSGQILQANGSGAVTFETPAASGGMTLIATATTSAATTISFTSIPSTYKHLMLIWRDVFQSDANAFFSVRLNNDSSAVYSYSPKAITATTVQSSPQTMQTSFGAANGDIYGPICRTDTSATDPNNTSKGTMAIYRYTDTGNRFVEWSTTGAKMSGTAPLGTILNFAKGIYAPSSGSAITQIDFIRNSTQTITGTVYLYGVS